MKVFLLWLFLHDEPLRMTVTPTVVYAGKPLRIQIHAQYEYSDRWMRLEWDPPQVGNSEWPVDVKSRSFWLVQRRVYEPGSYRVSAVIGGRQPRARVTQAVEVIE